MTADQAAHTPAPDSTSPAVESDEKYVTVGEAAKAIGKHAETIRRWIQRGEIVSRQNLSARGRPYEVEMNSVWRKADEGQTEEAPPGGGIFDPAWGPFTRDPFHSD